MVDNMSWVNDKMDSAIVVFDRVQKSYDGENLVVKDLNISVDQGEFLTLLGPSGSGKTTCLMMLAGFETPTHGEIYLKGMPINALPPHKRDIGVVFQNYALFPHMTVAENLAFPLNVRKYSRAEISDKVYRALDMVQLSEFGARRPAQLSGGQQQRVALARALVFEPELVLMDEPLGALDKNLREEMQYEIKHIHENLGVTIIYVTHDQTEALTMSNRIAVFNDGVIQQLSCPEDLYERPNNAFCAQFIGENNRLMGHVEKIDADICQVKTDHGDAVLAKKINVKNVGDRATLSLRPECVTINPDKEKYENVFPATVEELIYLGDHIRTRFNIGGQNDFIVKLPYSARQIHLKPQQTVTVGWKVDDCLALDG